MKAAASDKQAEIAILNNKFKQEFLEKEKEFSNRIQMVQNLNEQVFEK